MNDFLEYTNAFNAYIMPVDNNKINPCYTVPTDRKSTTPFSP